jgi:hypothetical protein
MTDEELTDTQTEPTGPPSSRNRKVALGNLYLDPKPGYALSVVLRDTPAFDDDLLRANPVCEMLTQTMLRI